MARRAHVMHYTWALGKGVCNTWARGMGVRSHEKGVFGLAQPGFALAGFGATAFTRFASEGWSG